MIKIKKFTKRGFTFIEILVVIAIIGILSSAVFVGLNAARTKANLVKIQQQLNQARTAAEAYFASNGNYGLTATTVCSSGIFNDSSSGMSVYTVPETYPAVTNISCASTPELFAITAEYIVSDETKYICVDNSGKSITVTTDNIIPTMIENAQCPE